MRKRSPTKRELAQWKVMQESGLSANSISKQAGRDHKTVMKYLKSSVYDEDEKLKELVETIKKREIEDLYLLGAKGRKRLHDLIDQGDSKMIETIALVDRTFQQRRLLEGNTTANLGILGKLIVESESELGTSMIPKNDRKGVVGQFGGKRRDNEK